MGQGGGILHKLMGVNNEELPLTEEEILEWEETGENIPKKNKEIKKEDIVKNSATSINTNNDKFRNEVDKKIRDIKNNPGKDKIKKKINI